MRYMSKNVDAKFWIYLIIIELIYYTIYILSNIWSILSKDFSKDRIRP